MAAKSVNRYRKFVFDESGQICGYQCAVVTVEDGQNTVCGELIRTPEGFQRHIRRKHGIHEQGELNIIAEPEEAVA